MKGFTLIEVLVVLALLLVCGFLLTIAFKHSRQEIRKASCLSNLHQIGQAALLYQVEQQEILPWCTSGVNSQYNYWWQKLTPYISDPTKLYHCMADAQFNENAIERTISYGWNYKLAGHGNTQRDGNGNVINDFMKIQNYARPSQVLLASDGPGGAEAGQEDSWGYIDERREHSADPWRHAGTANALFLDGHIQSFPASELTNPIYLDRTLHK